MGNDVTSDSCSLSYNITEETTSDWIHTPVDTIITTIIIPIIVTIGIFNNTTFVFVIFRIPRMRSETNIYLVHLALADLLFLCLSALQYFWLYATSPVFDSVIFVTSAECVSFFVAINTGYFASIALITMVSFERYLAMCHPLKHLRIRTRKRTNKIVAICWSVGLVLSGLAVLRNAKITFVCLQWPDDDMYHEFPLIVAFCGVVQPWINYLTTPLLNIPWIVALVSNIYMYIKIIQMLHNRTAIGRTSQSDLTKLRTRNQVVKMLIVNGVVFFLCQMPYAVLSFTKIICIIAGIPDPIQAALGMSGDWIFVIPQLINNSVNPLIYGLISAQYRTAFTQAFQCKKHHRQPKSIYTVCTASNRAITTGSLVKNVCKSQV